ncbi:hypothetical protein CRG98_035346 [Punica granatum]|uniref:HMA domain-containing protein n=1 Tax=Punica granatum TaxID=22663 RepID=A0A2I0IJW6_PUNGR|nr:hypothetical protein CRG98_035346 [Punica granatum]
MQTVKIKVKMDCDGCERKVRNAVSSMKGAKSVEVNRKQSLVVVSGYVEPRKVLEEVKSTGKKAEFWPYGPIDLNAPQAQADPDAPGEVLANYFSEENPNACSIM